MRASRVRPACPHPFCGWLEHFALRRGRAPRLENLQGSLAHYLICGVHHLNAELLIRRTVFGNNLS